MEVRKEGFVYAYAENCRKRQYHYRIKDRVIGFVIQLELEIAGIWRPLVRYDTAHGFAHQDILRSDGKIDKIRLPIQDYNEAMTWAQEELDATWELHKERYLREISK